MYSNKYSNNKEKSLSMNNENELTPQKRGKKVFKTILTVLGVAGIAAIGAAFGNDKTRGQIIEGAKKIGTGVKDITKKVFTKKPQVSNVPEIDTPAQNQGKQAGTFQGRKDYYRRYNN